MVAEVPLATKAWKCRAKSDISHSANFRWSLDDERPVDPIGNCGVMEKCGELKLAGER